jgi:hypothetical protein
MLQPESLKASFTKIVSRYQTCQVVKNDRRFRDHVCPYIRSLSLKRRPHLANRNV